MPAPVQVGPSPNGGGPVPSLTEREVRIIRLISQGFTYRQIGNRIGLGEDSVKPAVSRLLRKLGAENSAHAVLLACRAGVVDGRPRSGPERHGDPAGFRRHERRGEEPCEYCREGRRAYQREWTRARRSASVNST